MVPAGSETAGCSVWHRCRVQLVRLSDYYVNLMTAEGDASLSPVGVIYQSRLHILIDAYQEYMDGVSRAKQFLQKLASSERYTSFIQVQCMHDIE